MSKEQIASPEKALLGRVPLREGEITLHEAFRRLEIPMYGLVAAAARVVGWTYDVYQAMHGRIIDPEVVSTSTLIKYGPVVATGAIYYSSADSVAWNKVEGLRVRSKRYFNSAKEDPKKYVSEPVRTGLRDGFRMIKSSWQKLWDVTEEQESSLLDKSKEIVLGGMHFGLDFTRRTFLFGLNVFAGTVRYGVHCGREVVCIGSQVWFVNRGLRKVLPIVHAVDEFTSPQLIVDLPPELENALFGTPYAKAEIRRV